VKNKIQEHHLIAYFKVYHIDIIIYSRAIRLQYISYGDAPFNWCFYLQNNVKGRSFTSDGTSTTGCQLVLL